MKKIDKKQKLIGFISILLITIILAIIITTNIISNNNQVENEGYLATTSNAGSNLIASYIKKGITIGGITGTLEILDTSDATAKEEDIVWGKTGYVKGKKITGKKVVTVAHGKESQKNFETDTILIDDYGNTVKVPAGFKIAEDSATSVTGGVVIEDVNAGDNNTKGSQFVWVPVGDILIDNNGNTTTITLGRYIFEENGKETIVQSLQNWQDTVEINSDGITVTENQSNSYNNAKAKELERFLKMTQENGGYYIGRYEAGDADAIDKERQENDGIEHPVVCKKGVYPYNYVTQGQSSILAKNMYNSSNFESDLVNSYAWDTAIAFIQRFSGDTNYAKQIGTSYDSSIRKLGENLLLNNSKDVRCNIYDMAGNTYEWTTETCLNIYAECVSRGGFSNSDQCTDFRHCYNSTGGFVADSFRIILYF